MESIGADPLRGGWSHNLREPINYGVNIKVVGVNPSSWKMNPVDKTDYPSKFPNCMDDVAIDYVPNISGEHIQSADII